MNKFIGAIALLTIAPLILTLVGLVLALLINAFDLCTSFDSCLLLGLDVGKAVEFLLFSHWFAMFTIPAGTVLLIVLMIIAAVMQQVAKWKGAEDES